MASTHEYFVTDVVHGEADGKRVTIPAGTDVSKSEVSFSDDELQAFRDAGVVQVYSDVNSDLADENARKDLEIANLRAQLEAARSRANQDAPDGSGAQVLNTDQSDAQSNENDTQENQNNDTQGSDFAKLQGGNDDEGRNEQNGSDSNTK